MRNFKRALEKDMQLERKILKRDRDQLRRMPEGYLSFGGGYYYQNLDDGTRKYIPVRQAKLIRRLAMKGLIKKRIAVLEQNLKYQQKTEARYIPYDDDTLLTLVSSACRNGLKFRQDADVSDSAGGFASTGENGDRRSKSEVIISNLLRLFRLRFEYEKPLYWPPDMDPEKEHLKVSMHLPDWILPDFTIFLPSGKVIYWEHLGLLKDPAYLEKWKKKMLFYHMLGINLGDNLIVTCDTYEGWLDSQKIAEIIEGIMKK